MTEKSASDVLREMLDERGIEWRSGLEGVTFVGDWCFVEYDNGKLAATCEPVLTPEQAISATLGKQKAKAHPYGYEPDTGAFDVTRCECGCLNDISATYCNDCGGVIEVDMNAEKEIYHTPRHLVFAEKHDDGSLEFGGKRYIAATLGEEKAGKKSPPEGGPGPCGQPSDDIIHDAATLGDNPSAVIERLRQTVRDAFCGESVSMLVEGHAIMRAIDDVEAATLGNVDSSADDALALLDEIREAGRISYDDYSRLFDAIAILGGGECEMVRVSNTQDTRKCSACGKLTRFDYPLDRDQLNYCPKCGARVKAVK